MNNINKEDINRIIKLSKQFDKENYGAIISGHFDSDNEYKQMKIDFIYKKLK